MSRLVPASLLTAALLVAFACGGGGTTSGPSGTTTQASVDGSSLPGTDAGTTATTHVVEVGPNGSMTFNPAQLAVKRGDTVRWVVKSSGHTVTSGSGCSADGKFCNPSDASCASAPLMSAGQTYEHTFGEAGTFPYFCSAHCGSGMTGNVTVAP